MVARIQQVARALTCLYVVTVGVGVLVPMGTHIGTLKWRIGNRLTSGVVPISNRPLSGEQVAAIGDHALNAFMLLPLTFLATLGWPQVHWWIWGISATIIGAGSESIQYAFSQLGRRPLVSNAVENAAGGWLGAGLAAGLQRRLSHRLYSPSHPPHRESSERYTHQ